VKPSERGFILDGRRRLRIAKEEGIEPVVQVLRLDDDELFALLRALHTGFAPLGVSDKRGMANYFYGDPDNQQAPIEWSIDKIIQVLEIADPTAWHKRVTARRRGSRKWNVFDCESCGEMFVSSRADARYRKRRCRQRAYRERQRD
jgi:hypothetical protein